MKKKENFVVSKFYNYSGPNYYLNRPAFVFNISILPDTPKTDFFKEKIIEQLPQIEENYPKTIEQLYAKIIQQVSKMDLNLFLDKYSVMLDGEDWTIAIESIDEYLSEDIMFFVNEWFNAIIDENTTFDFKKGFTKLQNDFNNTLYGGPTIYSLIEAGVKRGVPVHYLYEENSFQWGYGRKQQRGRSTIFHTDGIKDTEFTTYKDLMGDFLEMCGLPIPKGVNCYTEEEMLEAVEDIGFPIVIKPVAGHKGQGVTTGIESIPEAKKAFHNIAPKIVDDPNFDGALVQQQIYGYDHRILTVGGKFVACLKREPAFVIGDGKLTIKELIDEDNKLEIRADTARSELCKIHLDADMHDYIKLQGLTSDHVPAKDEKIVLRRVANISQGGVSFNVTNEMHPKNIEMAENIAKFFNVTAMGIDVLAKDISKPWQEGNFGIIEINAGPGVFMHLAPAFGGSIDVPDAIMEHFFGNKPTSGKIPIIAGNYITNNLVSKIFENLKEIKPDIELGSVRQDGVYFNNKLLTNNKHDENCKILFRNPKLDFAILEHTNEDIHDFGTWHIGHDIAILDKPNYAEEILQRDLNEGGLCFIIEAIEEENNEKVPEISEKVIQKTEKVIEKTEIVPEKTEIVSEKTEEEVSKMVDNLKYKIIEYKNKEKIQEITVLNKKFIDTKLFELIEPHLKDLIVKYE